jgi:hypothetical protein
LSDSISAFLLQIEATIVQLAESGVMLDAAAASREVCRTRSSAVPNGGAALLIPIRAQSFSDVTHNGEIALSPAVRGAVTEPRVSTLH